MKRKLKELVEAVFERSAFEEALLEALADAIDYDEVAASFLMAFNDDITDIAAEVAEELF